MTPQDILSLQPGPAMDAAVHSVVFANDGKCLKYSTSDKDAAKLQERLPVFVGRVAPTHPKYDLNRPWLGCTLDYDATNKGDLTLLRVTSGTRLAALCKVALMLMLHPAAVATATAGQRPPANVARPRPTAPRAQPGPARSFRQPRPPMPKRPEKFVAPQTPAPGASGGAS